MNRTIITIAGKQYPVSFGLGTAYLFCKERGIEMYDFDKHFFGLNPKKLPTSYFEDYALLIKCGIKYETRKDPEQPDLDILDIINWITENPEENARVGQLLYGSMPDDQEEDNDDKTKKKKKKFFSRGTS